MSQRQKVNGKDTGVVNIHGREYKTVALRVEEFRSSQPDWSIQTFIVTSDAEYVVMRAVITDEKDIVRATGHAEERRGATQINRTSALENCETSAIGRALACMGFGGSEFASADEVANAIHQQRNDDGQRKADPEVTNNENRGAKESLLTLVKKWTGCFPEDAGSFAQTVLKACGWQENTRATEDQLNEAIGMVLAAIENKNSFADVFPEESSAVMVTNGKAKKK